ncbi:MAG TPA: TIR domain-containing protein [Vicinamibacterales bacterium]|nr:TIR domain-containing protein [Vicinamibacterales bacterium]
MNTAHARNESNAPVVVLPALQEGSDLQIELLRERGELGLRAVLLGINVVIFVVYAAIVVAAPEVGAILALYGLYLAALMWFSRKLMWAYVEGNSVQVGPNQYPQVYEVLRDAAAQLSVPMPKIFIMQGSGLIDILVAKQFTRRGYIIVLSDLMDALIESGTSRELLMLIGRQLGHIKAGHFRLWLFKDVIGQVGWLIHSAYWRRCHLTADRIGLMVAGDLYAAEQSLLMLTVGPKLAAHTNMDEIDEQAEHLADDFWPRLYRLLSKYPHIIERISRLRQFADTVHSLRQKPGSRPAIGALPIRQLRLRSLPVMMVHGHDHAALLELKDFLRSHYPYVEPVVMSLEMLGAASMPEKFERLASQARGAIALLTPDDFATVARERQAASSARARQNVVLEIGWFWGRLGRGRCLLLSHGRIEIPSDLAGVDCLEYIRSPREHFEGVRSFIAQLEQLESGSASVGAASESLRTRPAERARPATAVISRAAVPAVVAFAGAAIAGSGPLVRGVEPHVFCPQCSTTVAAGSRFCEECGTAVSAR